MVGIVCALASEARHLDPTACADTPIARLADGSLLRVSGMGAAAARQAAEALLAAGASALASFGLAGGLDPALGPGAIFLPSEVAGADGAVLATSRPWRERLAQALHAQRPRAEGRLLGSAVAVGSVAQKAALFRASGAAAVDMESLAVAMVAHDRAVPFIAVRVIVDAAGDALPPAVTAAADAAGHLKLRPLVLGLLRSPAQLGALLRLARCYRAASRSLALVARSGPFAPLAVS